MRSKNPELMQKIKAFAEDYYEEHGVPPSNKIISDAMGIGRSTVYYYLVEMAKRNIISYIDGVISSEKIEKFMQPVNHAGLVGAIPCGEPDECEAMIEEYIPLPVSIFGKGDFYVLRASGDSMEDAGISNGDLVVIKVQPDCQIGDIIVALDGENQNTLKRYGGTDDEGYALLEYMNETAYPDKVIRVRELSVQGVACHVIKQL